MLCAICGNEFERRTYNQIYCSEGCKHKADINRKKKYKYSLKGQKAEFRYRKGEAYKQKEQRYRSKRSSKDLDCARAKRYYHKHINNEEFLVRKRKKDKIYRSKNHEGLLERNRIARKKYRQTENGKANNKKQKLLRRALGDISIETIMELQKEQKCYYCGNEIVGTKTIDHKIPVIKGGTNQKDNLCVACVHCNTQKNSKTEAEYWRWLNENSM